MILVRISILIILSSYAMGNEWSEWSSYEIEPIRTENHQHPTHSDETTIKSSKDLKVTKLPTTAIMIIGGYGGGYPGSPEIQRDELVQGPTKCNIPELPRTDSGGLRFTERNIFLFQFENDTLISCGGTNAVDIKLCYKLDPKTHSWSMHSTLLHMRYSGAAITMPNGMYIFGGGRGGSENTYEFLPRNSNSWQMGSVKIPKGFIMGCVVKISDDEVVLIGGLYEKNWSTGRSTMTRVLKFNVKTEQFTAWPNLNQGRFHHSCTLLNDKIMVVGGFEGGMGEGMSLTSTEIIPLSTRIPVAGGDLNLDRSLFGLVTIGTAESQKLIAIGGYGTMGHLDDSEEWNDTTQKWKPTTRYSLYRKRRSFGYLSVAASSVCSE